jgi:CheY-like chemotaxis protein
VGNVLKAALENVGYKVTLVNDVVKGFGVVFQGMPDGIVLDMMEPDTNALDLIRFVRKQKTSQHVPILAVSGALAGFQMNQALSAGADSFLGKPVSVEALLESVAKAWTPQPEPALLGGVITTGRLNNPQLASQPVAPPETESPAAAPPKPAAPSVTAAQVDNPSPLPVTAAPPAQFTPTEKAVKPEALPTPPAPPAGQAKPAEKVVKPEPTIGQAKPAEKVVKPEPAAARAQEVAKSVPVPPKPEPAAPKADPLPRIKPLPPRS